MKNLLLCSIILLAFGCNSTKTNKDATSNTTQLKDASYTVISVAGEDVSEKQLTLSISEGASKISGFSGCNKYFGSINPVGSETLFSGLGSTKMYCDGNMATEKLFMNQMQKITIAEVVGDLLNLKDAKGTTLVVLK